ncbi:MAG: histidinol-phosphate aminotransferase [Dasania sp.]|jgi:histidinol-phosphate aminotransferase
MDNLSYNDNLNDIAVYKAGQSTLIGIDKVIKLSSNENPYGTSPKASDAFNECTHSLFKYPDGSAAALTRAISEFYKIDYTRIICGAGSDNILELLCLAFATKGDDVIFSKNSFPVYRIATQMAGANTVEVPYAADYRHDIDAIIGAINHKTRIIFIATPDNPTGHYVPQSQMQKLIDAVPSNCLLVIDEAYYEYVTTNDYKSGLEFANEYPNIAVTRTFSKLFGLAALRVGWGYVPPIAAEALNKIRSPFNVCLPAQKAATAALQDPGWIQSQVERNSQQREKMIQYYQLAGCRYIPSQANFICIIRDDSAELDQFLKTKGIIVRSMAGNGTPELMRISIGTEAQNKALQIALSEYLS